MHTYTLFKKNMKIRNKSNGETMKLWKKNILFVINKTYDILIMNIKSRNYIIENKWIKLIEEKLKLEKFAYFIEIGDELASVAS